MPISEENWIFDMGQSHAGFVFTCSVENPMLILIYVWLFSGCVDCLVVLIVGYGIMFPKSLFNEYYEWSKKYCDHGEVIEIVRPLNWNLTSSDPLGDWSVKFIMNVSKYDVEWKQAKSWSQKEQFPIVYPC